MRKDFTLLKECFISAGIHNGFYCVMHCVVKNGDSR